MNSYLIDRLIGYCSKLGHSWSSYEDNYGRDIIEQWARETLAGLGRPVCLDVGCGECEDLAAIRRASSGAVMHALDIDPERVACARQRGYEAGRLNLESEKWPYEDGVFDLIVANQVFEHLKNWTLAVTEAARTLKLGGTLIVGVPNLASLHNRILLALGRQPTCIHPAGMHVRGFTYPGMLTVLGHGGVFRVRAFAGRVFYPFPEKAGTVLSRLWPTGSASLFLRCEREGEPSAFDSIEAIQRQGELSLD